MLPLHDILCTKGLGNRRVPLWSRNIFHHELPNYDYGTVFDGLLCLNQKCISKSFKVTQS